MSDWYTGAEQPEVFRQAMPACMQAAAGTRTGPDPVWTCSILLWAEAGTCRLAIFPWTNHSWHMEKSTTSDMEDTVSFSFVFAEILKLNLWSLTGRTLMSICLSSILPKQPFHLWSAGLKGVSGRLIRKKGCPSIPKNSGEALSGRQAILRAVAAERRSPYCANISNSNGHRN